MSSTTTIRDLGVFFSSNLSFRNHISTVASRAFRILGFIHRASRYFESISSLKLLYCSLVRPRLEYWSVIWSPYQRYLCVELERVQHKFLCIAARKLHCPMSTFEHDYTHIINSLKHLTLKNRRVLHDLLFAHQILNGTISSSELLYLFGLVASPVALRRRDVLHQGTHRTNYGQFDCINRIFSNVNKFSDSLNFFGSHSSFKSAAVQLLLSVTET